MRVLSLIILGRFICFLDLPLRSQSLISATFPHLTSNTLYQLFPPSPAPAPRSQILPWASPCLAALLTPLGWDTECWVTSPLGHLPHHTWTPTSYAGSPTLWNPSFLHASLTPCVGAPQLNQPPFHLTHGHIFVQPYLPILEMNCSG